MAVGDCMAQVRRTPTVAGVDHNQPLIQLTHLPALMLEAIFRGCCQATVLSVSDLLKQAIASSSDKKASRTAYRSSSAQVIK